MIVLNGLIPNIEKAGKGPGRLEEGTMSCMYIIFVNIILCRDEDSMA